MTRDVPIVARSARRAGFTLIEMLMCVAILGVAAALVLPAVRGQPGNGVLAAAAILRSDLEYAQVHNITRPDDPVVMRLEEDGNRWWLARADTPDVPMARPDTGEPYEVVLGAGRGLSGTGVSLSVRGLRDDTIEWSPQGGLDDFTEEPVLGVGAAGVWIFLEVAPATGSINEWGPTATP